MIWLKWGIRDIISSSKRLITCWHIIVIIILLFPCRMTKESNTVIWIVLIKCNYSFFLLIVASLSSLKHHSIHLLQLQRQLKHRVIIVENVNPSFLLFLIYQFQVFISIPLLVRLYFHFELSFLRVWRLLLLSLIPKFVLFFALGLSIVIFVVSVFKLFFCRNIWTIAFLNAL
jgi:hypothetical protein